jgi:cobalamin biosynthesis protein CobT
MSTSEANSKDNDLLLQQTAAIIVWLKEQNLDTTATALQDELVSKLGKDTALRLASKSTGGCWQWMPQELPAEPQTDQDNDVDESGSSEYQTDSSDDEESSSSEDSEEDESDSDADDDEDDVDDDDEDDANNSPETQNELETTKEQASASVAESRRSLRRSVSFDSAPDNEFFYSPVRKSEKSRLFWTKNELREMKNEEAMEKMTALMSDCVFKVPGLPSG